jgi:aspartate/methionine/tyrosine aminotransferase
MSGREFARQLIQSKRVLVNPGEPFGPSGEDHVRISYATEDGRLREGLQRLTEFMAELVHVRGPQTDAPPEAPVAALNGTHPE